MMPTPRDRRFAEAVVQEGLVSREKVQECIEEMQHAESIGAVVALDAVLVKKGLISRRQADAVLEAAAREGAPKRIAGFEILEPIGRGGMHTVYKARQVSLDRVVALKILSPELSQSTSHVERLFKEARAVAKVSHVNIIQGIDAGESSGYYYFAAELVDGEALSDKLRREGSISEAEALNIVEQVCRALSHIQSFAGMIHGDIKPANIMLTKDGVAKLADLGLARAIGGSQRIAAGSPHYISPEQARNSPSVDTRSDIYSLGATLFHMITGSPPYTGSDPKAVIASHLNAPIPLPQAPGVQPSAGISRLITVMLAKAPTDRYQSPDELLADVRRVRSGLMPVKGRKMMPQGESISLTSVPPARTSRRGVAVAAGVLIAGLVVVIAVTATRGKKGDTEQQTVVEDPTDGTQQRAAELYASVEGFEQEHPGELKEIAERYAEVVSRYPLTTWAEKAVRKAQAARGRRDAQAAAAFERLKGKAEALAADERYHESMNVWLEYPTGLAFGKWREAVKEEVNRAKEKALSRTEELLKKAEALAENERYGEAIQALQPGLNFGIASIAGKMRARIEEYAQARENLALAGTRKAQEELLNLLTTIARHERSRRYDLALEAYSGYQRKHEDLVAQATADPARAALMGELRELKAEIETGRDTWNSVLAALRNAAGREIEIRVSGILLKGKLCNVTDTTFAVEINDNEITKQLADIDTPDAMELAGLTRFAADDQKAILDKVRFCLATGDTESAREAATQFADGDMAEAWSARIRQRRALITADNMEREAQQALAELQEDARDDRWKEVYVKLRKCRQAYGGAAAYRAAKDELEALLAKTEAGLAANLGIEHYDEGEFLALLVTLREVVAWQKEQACPRTIPCPECKGKGYKPRPERCPRCDGRGTIECPRCRGNGYIYTRTFRATCTTCFGGGRIRCPTCRGQGVLIRKEPCMRCRSTGEVPNPVGNGTGYKERMPRNYEEALRDLEQRYRVSLENVRDLLEE